MTKPLYSFHAFLFPFEWRQRHGSPRSLLEDQTNLELIRPNMESILSDWKLTPSWLEPTSLVQYNEANYFYDFVRPVLYGDDKAKFQVHYQHQKARGSHYLIHHQPSNTIFKLEVDDIGVSFYNTGVGVLSIHCYNREHQEPDDILKINQFGRRVFPPFYGTNDPLVGSQEFFEDENWAAGLERVKKKELANALVFEKDGEAWAIDDFTTPNTGPSLDAIPEMLNQLFPRSLVKIVHFTPVLDDRMFVVCWYGNDELANKIKTFDSISNDDSNDWWYKYVFVDGGMRTCQNDDLALQLLKGSTNTRWINYGTLYGISRYSLVCLTGTLEQLQKPWANAAFLISHMQTIYFKLAELALVQRACLMRFSEEVTAIADLHHGDKHLPAKAGSLTRQFIRFINKIYFREVTAQDQGIEMYDKLMEQMRIHQQKDELDKEIQELHQYVTLEEERKRNDKLDVLTYLGSFFIGPSFICGYLALYDFNDNVILVAALCVLASALTFAVVLASGRWRTCWLVTGVIFLLLVLFVLPNANF